MAAKANITNNTYAYAEIPYTIKVTRFCKKSVTHPVK